MGSTRLNGIQRRDDERPLDVLVVDDHELNRLIMKTLLTEFGCDVSWAETGETAIDLAARKAFDLVVMDLHLPGVDGDEATSRIRAAGASRNAYVARWSTDVSQTLRVGLYDSELPKPITCDALAGTVAMAAIRAANVAEQRTQPPPRRQVQARPR